jgi:hypothetical protein
VRNKEIKLTPEEAVRQLYLMVLIQNLNNGWINSTLLKQASINAVRQIVLLCYADAVSVNDYKLLAA